MKSQKCENKELKGIEKYLRRKKNSPKRITKANDVQRWVSDCDAAFSEYICGIAEDILRRDGVKVIRLVGPTCSGKTTAANMLAKSFEKFGKRLHTISIDDFYYDTDALAQMSSDKGHESIDYDSPDTIDIAELSRFVDEIFSSDLSHCPVFDFTTGKREGYREYRCTENDLFLFEGIQALYPNVSEIFSASGHSPADVFIAPRSSVKLGEATFEPNEIRLMRRLVRDANFRNTKAEFTFYLWEASEKMRKRIYSHTLTLAVTRSIRLCLMR